MQTHVELNAKALPVGSVPSTYRGYTDTYFALTACTHWEYPHLPREHYTVICLRVLYRRRRHMSIAAAFSRAAADSSTVVSLELCVPQTERGVANLLRRARSLKESLRPAFVSLAWRASARDENAWLRVGTALAEIGLIVLMHVTCHLPRDVIVRLLSKLRTAGLCNVLALRGDTPGSDGVWRPPHGGLHTAMELVRMIRELHGDYFCIGVAGYPEVHVESWNSRSLPPSEKAQLLDIARLRDKVACGAQFVMSQFVCDASAFTSFVQRCREAGITVPIVPTLLPVSTYESWSKIVAWSRTRVPPAVSPSRHVCNLVRRLLCIIRLSPLPPRLRCRCIPSLSA